MSAPDVRIKRIYDPAAADDGLRVLVTTYWPRGVSRQAVPRWERDLGVPVETLRPWLDHKLSPQEFERQYLAYLHSSDRAQAALRSLLADQPERITLLTSLKDLQHSHLHLLKAALLAMAGGSGFSGTSVQ